MSEMGTFEAYQNKQSIRGRDDKAQSTLQRR